MGNPQAPEGPGSLHPALSATRQRKEVMSTTAASDLEASAEGVRQSKPDSVP